MVIKSRKCLVKIGGIIPYETAWREQRGLQEERINNPDLDDILLLLEHPPVYTLGTGSDTKFIKFNPACSNAEIYRVERGGEVTYHCIGQLVGYPILNLRYYKQDLHWYLRQLEEVLIQALKAYKLEGRRIPGLTGVWVEGYKVAAIGIKASRWVTLHGFSLNVCPDMSGFDQIVPCGIEDKPVGSLQQFLGPITVADVREHILAAFAEVFGVELILMNS